MYSLAHAAFFSSYDFAMLQSQQLAKRRKWLRYKRLQCHNRLLIQPFLRNIGRLTVSGHTRDLNLKQASSVLATSFRLVCTKVMQVCDQVFNQAFDLLVECRLIAVHITELHIVAALLDWLIKYNYICVLTCVSVQLMLVY